MNIDAETLIMLVIILFSVIMTVKSVFINRDLETVISSILSSISIMITFFIVIIFYEKFDLEISVMLRKFFSESIENNGIIHIAVLGIVFIILKLIVEYILNIFYSIFLKNIFLNKRNNAALGIFSIIFGFVRGFIFILLIFMCLSLYNSITSPDKKILAFSNNKIYTKVADIVDKSEIASKSDGIQKKVSDNKVVYYNGITIDEGVASNDAINAKAIEITKGEKSDKGKAKTIYTWIGINIAYDDEKAMKILNEGEDIESGAIAAFRDKKGICLDYACLYTAMAKAVGLKTRIVIGEAYNGQEYVSHSWNEVYIPKEDRWINVDSTFYVAGDYFDSSKFQTQYREESIAGEF